MGRIGIARVRREPDDRASSRHQEGSVAFSFRCADMGGACPVFFVAQTQEELLEHVELHARRVHPALLFDEATRVMIRAEMRLV